jgi:hypothetical protein
MIAFFACFSSILDTVIYGLERVDREENLTFRRLLKSRFFRVPALWYLLAPLYLALVYFVTLHASNDPIMGTLSFTAVNLIFTLLGVIIRYRISQQIVSYSIPKALLKYWVASMAMAGILYILPPPKRIITTFLGVSLGVILYFGILAIIEPEILILTRYVHDRLKKKTISLMDKIVFNKRFHHKE